MNRCRLGLALIGLVAAGCSSSSSTTTHPTTHDLAGFSNPLPDLARTETLDLATSIDGGSDLAVATDGGVSTCASPKVLTSGVTLANEDNSTSTDVIDGACELTSASGTLYYAATVPAGDRLSVTVSTTDASFDAVLRILDVCGAQTCLGTADSGGAGDPETATYANTSTSSVTVILAVAGYDVGGVYAVSPTIAPIPAGAVCSTATALVPGTPLTNQDSSSAIDDAPTTCTYSATGTVLYYALTVPARTDMQITATPTGTAWDIALAVLTDCTGATCPASADQGADGDPEMVTYRNATTSAKTVIVAVGGSFGGATGTFDLSAVGSTLPPAPANATCSSATAVSDGTTLSMQDASQGTDDLGADCLTGDDGTVLYYSVTIPAQSRLGVSATPDTAWNPVVRVLSACNATTCLASSDASGSGAIESLSYRNTTSAAVPVIIAVGSDDASSSGTFSLAIHIAALPPPPTNLTCSAATAVSNGSTLTSQDLTAATMTENACLTSDTGNVLFYSTSIPAGSRLLARANPIEGWDVDLRLINACSATTCLSSIDSGTGKADLLSYRNTGSSALPVTFAVGSDATTDTGTFDLSVWTRAVPTNLTCAAATTVSTGAALVAEDGADATSAPTNACLSSADGDVLYYKLVIPGGQTLTAVATPDGYWDMTLRLLSTCSATSCLASADVGFAGDAETLTYQNTASGSATVYLVVGAYDAGTTDAFDLSVTIQ